MIDFGVGGTSRRFAIRTLASAALLLGLAARPAAAIVFQSVPAENAGLGAGQSFLDAEAKLVVTYGNSTQSGCSGSLLSGGAYILTAAHCVTGDNDTLAATTISIAFANTGLTLTSASYVVDPVWNGNLQNGGDLALISLAAPVTSITGYLLDAASSAIGATVTLAGYGLTGTGSTGATAGTFGTLYEGTNVYLGMYATTPSVYAYAFNQTGPDAVMIAPGDSGGGSLLNVNGTWEIVGVHDFTSCSTPGCTASSTFGNYGGDTSVYADAAFLNAVLVPEPATAALLVAGIAAALVRRRPASKPDRA